MKDEKERKINDEFVGLKSRMYSIKNIDGKESIRQKIYGKESNRAKGVNIAPEFNEFKNTLFNKKILTHNEKNSKQKA